MAPTTSLLVSVNDNPNAEFSQLHPRRTPNVRVKFAIHFGLVLAVSTQALISSRHSSEYNRAVNEHWRSALFRSSNLSVPMSTYTSTPALTNSFLIKTDLDAFALVQAFAETYFRLNSTMLNFYKFVQDSDGKPLSIETRASGGKNCEIFDTIQWNSPAIVNADNANSILSCFRSSSSIQFHAQYLGFRLTRRHRFCVLCRIELEFSLNSNKQAKIFSRCHRTVCSTDQDESADQPPFPHLSHIDVFLSVTVILLSLMSFVPSLLAFLDPGRRSAMRLIFLFGDFFGILASLINLLINNDLNEGFVSRSNARFFLGLCSLTCCTRLVRYMHFLFGSDSTALARILLHSLPEISRILIGCAPIIVGLTLAGMAFFAKQCSRFSSFGIALQSIFAMANGDYVQDAFRETDFDILIGKVYIVLIVTLITWTLLNTILARIQVAFYDEVPPQDFHSCRSRDQHFQKTHQLSPETKDRYRYLINESPVDGCPQKKLNIARLKRLTFIIDLVRNTAIRMTDEWMVQSQLDSIGHNLQDTDDICIPCTNIRRLQASVRNFMSAVKGSIKEIQHQRK